MQWNDRIENYARETGFPKSLFVGPDGRVVGTWIMGNDYRVKSAYYIAKHGLDFLQARQIFDGRPLVTYPSPRADEARFVSVGVLDGRMVAVVWLKRDSGIRLISMRRARDGEKSTYRELHGCGD